jgi:hypothetical protein
MAPQIAIAIQHGGSTTSVGWDLSIPSITKIKFGAPNTMVMIRIIKWPGARPGNNGDIHRCGCGKIFQQILYGSSDTYYGSMDKNGNRTFYGRSTAKKVRQIC